MMSKTQKQEERKFLLQCIDVYRELPALWRVKDKDYSNRQKKDEAYEMLLVKYREHYEDATKEDLKKKFNILRTNFRKEVKKEEESARSGAALKDCYVSSLWFYDALLFLKDLEVPDVTWSIVAEKTDEDGDVEEGEDVSTQLGLSASTTLNAARRSGEKRKRAAIEESQQDLISIACKCLKEQESSSLSLAKWWASEIAAMDPVQQILAKKAINDILFEGQMGTLHRGSVQINAMPSISIPQNNVCNQ